MLMSVKAEEGHQHMQAKFSCIEVLKVPQALFVEPGQYMTTFVLAVRMSFISLRGPRKSNQYLPAESISCLHGLQHWFPAIYPSTEPWGYSKSFPSSCDSPDKGNDDKIGFSCYLLPTFVQALGRSWSFFKMAPWVVYHIPTGVVINTLIGFYHYS